MVEVVRGGCIFFVPESMAYEQSDAFELTEEDGFDWAMGANTLPAPPKRTLQAIGIPEPIRQHFQALDLEALRQMSPDDERYKELPSVYHSAYPLDDPHVPRGAGGSFGYPSSVYKVVSREDAQMYALRRFDNVKTTASIVKNALERWRSIRHPSIVSLYNILLHHHRTLFFAHAYHPSARTLKQRFIDQQGGLLNEGLIWRFIAQLLAGIRAVHSRNLACRVIDPMHILITSGMRVRISCLGVPDVLEFESQRSPQDLQRDDLFALGRVILSLGTRSYVTPQNLAQATAFFSSTYSQELQNLVAALCKKPSLTVAEVIQSVSVHIMDELDMSMASTDALHGHLSNEYQNGRLLRLLFKLGTINERPSHGIDTQWSETGDRYILKLFRDYVFHQVLDDGSPVLDFGHIVSALNKLDIGDDERVLLTSRDDKSMLAASYADIKRCMEQAFQELYMQSQGQAMPPQARGIPTQFAGPAVGFMPPAAYEHPLPHAQAQPHPHHAHPHAHQQHPSGGRGHRGGGHNYRGGRGRRSGRFSR